MNPLLFGVHNAMQHLLTRLSSTAAIAGAAIFAAISLKAQSTTPMGEWPSYGATNQSQKYSTLDQITGANFKDLKIAWTWKTPDIELIANDHFDRTPALTPYGFKATPLVVKGMMYISTGLHQIAAIDPATGVTKWLYNPKAYDEGMQADVMGWISRGVAYWSGKNDERILMGTLDGYILALDAKTGKPILSFGDHGKTDLNAPVPRAMRNTLHLPMGETHYVSVDSPPVVVRDTVIVGSSMSDRTPTKEWPPGYVQAFDVRTGKLKWVFHTIPLDGEFGAETWKDNANRYTGNGNVWSMMSGDDELGIVYLPTTTPNSDYWGGARKGAGLFAECVVAVDVETGKRLWHFQAVHHGIWDYDFPAAPTLLDITVSGKRIKALAQVSKQGFTYVFDRVTGKPVWPIVERPVPHSNVPGEETSPTQPFPRSRLLSRGRESRQTTCSISLQNFIGRDWRFLATTAMGRCSRRSPFMSAVGRAGQSSFRAPAGVPIGEGRARIPKLVFSMCHRAPVLQ